MAGDHIEVYVRQIFTAAPSLTPSCLPACLFRPHLLSVVAWRDNVSHSSGVSVSEFHSYPYLQSQSLDPELVKGRRRLTPCPFQFVSLDLVSADVHRMDAKRCSRLILLVSVLMCTGGKSVPSGWFVCAKSNVSPKYAPRTGSSSSPVGHGLCCSPLCLDLSIIFC